MVSIVGPFIYSYCRFFFSVNQNYRYDIIFLRRQRLGAHHRREYG